MCENNQTFAKTPLNSDNIRFGAGRRKCEHGKMQVNKSPGSTGWKNDGNAVQRRPGRKCKGKPMCAEPMVAWGIGNRRRLYQTPAMWKQI